MRKAEIAFTPSHPHRSGAGWDQRRTETRSQANRTLGGVPHAEVAP